MARRVCVCLRPLHEPARRDHRQRRAAHLRPRFRSQHDNHPMGGYRLPAQPGGVHPRERMGRRPFRDEAHLHDCPSPVCPGLPALRVRSQHRGVDRLPGAAGRRRRPANARRHRHAHARLPAGGARAGRRPHRHSHGGGARQRPRARRLPRRVSVLALDLLHQCPHRHRRPDSGGAVSPRREAGKPRPPGRARLLALRLRPRLRNVRPGRGRPPRL